MPLLSLIETLGIHARGIHKYSRDVNIQIILHYYLYKSVATGINIIKTTQFLIWITKPPANFSSTKEQP